MHEQNRRTIVRNFVIELFVYAMLVVVYFLVVLRLLSEPLSRMFDSNLIGYAFIGIGLILAQSVLLDVVTSFFLDLLKLERLK